MSAASPDRAGRVPATRRRENALLLAASGCTDAAPVAINGGEEYDWRYLLDAANQQGVTALLRQSLRGAGAIAAPDWVRAELEAAYWAQHFRNRILLDALHTLLVEAASAGLPIMPLKGAALMHGYYPVPALRPMSDLDLLVRAEDLERMADLLQARGYLPVTRPGPSRGGSDDGEHAVVARQAGGTVLIEYRSEPLDPVAGFPVGLDPALAARLDTHAARMWERGGAEENAGAPFVRIAPEDLLLHVTSHLATRHAGFRLIWLHDVCRVLVAHSATFDFEYFWREAALLNLAVPVSGALEAAHRWLGAPLPPGGAAVGRFQAVRAVERRIIKRAVQGLGRADLAAEPRRAWGEAATAFCRLSGALPRARALAFFAVPSPDYLTWWMAQVGQPPASYRQMLRARWRRIGADLLHLKPHAPSRYKR